MIPSLLLLTSEPYNIFGKIVLLLFPLGLYLIVYSFTKNTGLIQLILFPLIIIHAFQLVLFYLFGEDVIAVDMFLNVVTTNPSEAGELLNSIWPSIVFVCVVYIPMIALAIRQVRKKVYLGSKFRKYTIPAGLLLILVSYVLSFFSINQNTGRFSYGKNVYPVNVFYNLNFAIDKWQKSNKYFETSKNFTFNARKDSVADKREIYVLVIGETSRSENWSLYGYDRKTNPLLEKKEGLVHFQDAITQSNTTHKSVSIMLSTASAENYGVIYEQKSIIDAFKEVGFKTVFLSNQGGNHSFTQFFAESADYYDNIRSMGNVISTVNNHDDMLIPLFQKYVDSVPDNLFIVIHTYGSHFNYRERYPDEFSVFKPDDVTEITRQQKEKLRNSYDNTILYTDSFLSEIMDMLQAQDACASLFYASDHGEDILDDDRMRFLHASPNPTYYQLAIPMLVWFSDNYKNVFPEKAATAILNKDKPVATNSVFHTLLDIASIQTDYLEHDLSLVNREFKVKKRMYLDDHDQPIFFYQANLKKEDKMMIEKRKVYH
ncbi:lipid A phosphoethanolamine transferase [Dysgonomonas sp. 520]|uniref:lipid A phosphoethanolamine transferase n=1 Tax=Dysgonomonas sp. 520 TaxID=2302931 RepID=UPI00210489E7|nr:lipid A phosphoethanolamine transferase [Dysgonomonas sp. 520]